MNKKVTVRNLGSLFVALALVLILVVPALAAAPLFNNQTLTIAENSPNGASTTPSQLLATDPQSSPLTFDVIGGTGVGIFAVNSSTGAVTVLDSAQLDYEQLPNSFTLIVRVTNSRTPPESKEATITINVTDVSDEPPVMGDQTFSVAENRANGTLVGKIAFTDLDVNDNHTFTINSGNGTGGGAFQIAGNAGNNTGNITVKDSTQLNFEATTQFVLNVTITDAGSQSATANITINVADVNEVPNVSDQQFFGLAENTPNGMVVGTVVATDPDAGDTIKFYRTSGSTAFAIDENNGKVTVADSALLDFETNPAPTFVVTVRDTAGLSDTATITVNLVDVNDKPRVVGGGIPDLFPNEGTTTATRNLWAAFEDDEDEDAQLTFAVQSNTNPDLFASPPLPDNGTGILTLNFASGATGIAELTVRATDTGGAWEVDTFKIDFNEAPVAVGYPNVTVQEDADTTSFSLYTGFTDAEQPSSALLYAIMSNSNSGLFTSVTINSAGEIVLDYAPDANGQAKIKIRATDGGGLWDETEFIVTINPVNDIPTTTGIPNVTVLEDAENTVIDLSKYFFDKEDGAAGLTYEVKSNSNENLFDSVTISGVTLTLDYKANAFGEATLVVRATDKGNPGQPGTSEYAESSFKVTITSVNDKPVLTSFEKSTNEDIPLTFTLADFSSKFSDVDGDPLSSVRIQSLPDSGKGTLVLNGVNVTLNQVIPAAQLGTLVFAPTLNWDQGTATFEWNASDGKEYADVPATVTISVQAVNDAPTISNVERTGPEGVNIIFTKEDFTLAFVDPEGQPLQKIRIASLPQHGTLKRGDINVNLNDQINVDLLNQLRYVPNQYFNGTDNFNWTGFDGELYSNPAQVILTITPENDPPVLDLNGAGAGVDFSTTFAAGGSPVAITSQNLTITDVDNDTMAGATVLIVGLKNGAKEKLSADVSGTGIAASYSVVGTNGLLQLDGVAPISDYVKVLKTVKYSIDPDITNPDTTTRNIQFAVYDGQVNSNDAYARVDVINPRITITITPEKQPVPKGGAAVFTVEVQNTGSVTLTNIVMTSAVVPACSRTNYSGGTIKPGEKISYACIVANVQDRIDNEIIVTANDVVVGSAVTAKDTGYVSVLREMVISVAPLASVGDVLVKGQDAKFTVQVVNPSEVDLSSVEVKAYVDYDFAVTQSSPTANVPAPTCDKVVGNLAAGKEYIYNCTIPNVQASFQIEVKATGMIQGITPTEDFDIDQISVLDLALDVSSSHFQVPAGEPTLVEFGMTLTNVSNVPLTLNSLMSSAHGNLLDVANLGVTNNSCPGIVKEIPAGEVRTCSYTATLTIQPPALTNLITAAAMDDGSRQVTVEDSAIVAAGDFSALEVNLTANPSTLPVTGGPVNLTVRVKNNTPGVMVLDDLKENGVSLHGQGNCEVQKKNIPANGEYSCVYSVTIGNQPIGTVVKRTVTAFAAALEATASANINITGVTRASILLPTVASGTIVGEPNNSICSALQIGTNVAHYFYAEDANDWYKFTINSTSDVRVKLSDFMVTEGQLMVYSGNCTNPTLLDDGHNGDTGVTPLRELVLEDLAAGTYHIWVMSVSGFRSDYPYRIEVITTTP